jgi:hypothetical protein
MTELAIPEASTSITPAQFDQAIAEAHLKAAKLKEIVEQAKLYVAMGAGKKYLMVEAWQTIGRAYGYTTKIVWSRPLETGGWEAHAVVIDALGVEVGAAEAESGTQGDSPWNTRPSFMQRSMAQTRATSKALRSLLSWVVVLAGYQATPADEMSGESAMQETAAAIPRSNWDSDESDSRLVTNPQLNRLFAIIDESSLDEDTVKVWMHAKYQIQSSKELTREQYDEFVAWIEAGGTEPSQEPSAEAQEWDGDVELPNEDQRPDTQE